MGKCEFTWFNYKWIQGTVHYVGVGDKTPADQVSTSKWIRTVTVDVVTNEVVPDGEFTTDWTIPSDEKSTYDQVDTPVVNGYYADQANVSVNGVTPNEPDTPAPSSTCTKGTYC